MTLTKEKKKQLVLVGLGGLLVLGCTYFFLFRGIDQARENTDKKAHDLKAKVAKMKQTVDQGQAAQRRIEQFKQALKPLIDQMPPEAAETWLAKATDTVATRKGLKLKGSRLVEPDPFVLDEFKEYGHFDVEGYAFNVQGTYFQLGEFLADLEGSYPLMVVESVSIQSGGGGAPHIHDMAVKITMVTEKS